MPRPFRFGLVAAQAPSHDVWVAIARRAEELGYSTLLIPDRTTAGTLAPHASFSGRGFGNNLAQGWQLYVL